MLPLLGDLTLWLAVGLALCAFLSPRPFFWWGQMVVPVVSVCLLFYAFGVSDLQLDLVASSGALGENLAFRLASTWANHQGSLLLWWAMIAGLGGIILKGSRGLPAIFMARCQRYHALLIFLMGTYILLTSSPFVPALPQMPLGLNPLLHDQGLLIHPPLLFLGYALTAMVSMVAFGLLDQIDGPSPDLLRLWRRVTGAAWSVLTIAIGLGAWWAYRELGWGGWWFWDPVENASLLPWLVLTALLHALPLITRYPQFFLWARLYAFGAWSLCLLGTFLVRSGLLISVHSFAVDPVRGLVLLIMLMVHTAVLYQESKKTGPHACHPYPLKWGSAPMLIAVQNYILLAVVALVGLGLFYPFFAEYVLGQPLSVGAAFYNQTALPLLALGVGVLVFLPSVSLRTSWGMLVLSIGFLFAVDMFLPLLGWARLWAILPAVLLASVVWDAPTVKMSRTMGHLALPLFIMAVLAYGYGSKDAVVRLRPDHPVSFGAQTLMLQRLYQQELPLYTALRADVDVTEAGAQRTLTLEKRLYRQRQTLTSEMTLLSDWRRDRGYLLGALHEDQQGIDVQIHLRSGMRLLWISWSMMALGGVIGLLKARDGRV